MTDLTDLRVLIIVDVQKCFLDGNLGIQGEKVVSENTDLEGGQFFTNLKKEREIAQVDTTTELYKKIAQLIVDNKLQLNQKGDYNADHYKQVREELEDQTITSSAIRGVLLHLKKKKNE